MKFAVSFVDFYITLYKRLLGILLLTVYYLFNAFSFDAKRSIRFLIVANKF
jgi:hypothetical protein